MVHMYVNAAEFRAAERGEVFDGFPKKSIQLEISPENFFIHVSVPIDWVDLKPGGNYVVTPRIEAQS